MNTMTKIMTKLLDCYIQMNDRILNLELNYIAFSFIMKIQKMTKNEKEVESF